MKFKKIYIEISDICGLSCSFCPAPKAQRGAMGLEIFERICKEAAPLTRLIALHMLGDPLKMPNLREYLDIARRQNLSVEITTSGVFLGDFSLLLHEAIRQVNFSLDAVFELDSPFLREKILQRIFDFCAFKNAQNSEIFVNLRVQKRPKNEAILEVLRAQFNAPHIGLESPTRVAKKTIIAPREAFLWGDFGRENERVLGGGAKKEGGEAGEAKNWGGEGGEIKGGATNERGKVAQISPKNTRPAFCYGLKEHFGILSNGAVVPCCVDVCGALNLGNAGKKSLKEILDSPRAKNIRLGFQKRVAIEPFCQSCDYKNRFA